MRWCAKLPCANGVRRGSNGSRACGAADLCDSRGFAVLTNLYFKDDHTYRLFASGIVNRIVDWNRASNNLQLRLASNTRKRCRGRATN